MKKSHNTHTNAPSPENPESLAALAEGMADNFNNILMTVMGACSLIDRDDPANSELLQYVALIRASAERAAALSDRLMRAGLSEQENANSDSNPQDSGSADTSVRDKKSTDDVLSPD
jgi:nitrogen-specific signal transduction histidine kinase